MKYLFFIATLLITSSSFAQAKERAKSHPYQFSIDGEVNKKIVFTLADSGKYTVATVDSLVIYNHLMERRNAHKNIRGILLKDVLLAAGLKEEKAKLFSQFYFTVVSYDGYKVVFSWNELFNNAVGKKVIVVTSMNGKTTEESDNGIVILSASDDATGRRLLYDVEKIIVSRVQ